MANGDIITEEMKAVAFCRLFYLVHVGINILAAHMGLDQNVMFIHIYTAVTKVHASYTEVGVQILVERKYFGDNRSTDSTSTLKYKTTGSETDSS